MYEQFSYASTQISGWILPISQEEAVTEFKNKSKAKLSP
jgi:hypothetical protein